MVDLGRLIDQRPEIDVASDRQTDRRVHACILRVYTYYLTAIDALVEEGSEDR